MTAAARILDETAPAPTVAVCAGRVLVLAGLVFGTANMVQYGVRSGALGWHEATLGLNWLVATGVFFPVLFRLRRIGGEAARRAAGWSRAAILTMVAAALVLAAASAVTGDWSLMLWASVATLTLYGLVWLFAFARVRRPGLALIAATAFAGSACVATRLGTPEQYLLQAVTLGLVAVLPGLWLALGRRL
ncbi:hypothetical protein N0B44_32150 [Roseibacterium beibuensis]|uniref:hypothetical protein n=1 Tax=[Roseibacterium] beibuensis TaxID=1193142 RepID=UPI00217D122A|nr:hypothetical protein [Roseibacterium beibuensis]MCS6627566.1 hypothetical protein [Roseibacterium beibuensis]